MSTACVADSSDPSVDAEFARLAKKYAPLARERDESSSRDGVIVDETALEAAQMRIDAEYRTASGESQHVTEPGARAAASHVGAFATEACLGILASECRNGSPSGQGL